MIFIFGNLTKSGEEACDILNICSSSLSKSHSRVGQRRHTIKTPNPIEDINKNTRFSPLLPRRTKRPPRKNTITVAHITDIHVEPGYLNVSTNVLSNSCVFQWSGCQNFCDFCQNDLKVKDLWFAGFNNCVTVLLLYFYLWKIFYWIHTFPRSVLHPNLWPSVLVPSVWSSSTWKHIVMCEIFVAQW